MAEGGRSPLEPGVNPEWVRVAITGSCGGNRSEVVWIDWCAGTVPVAWPGYPLGPSLLQCCSPWGEGAGAGRRGESR